MDAETIRRIAAEIAHNMSYPWSFLAVQAVLMVLAAAAGTYFGSYLKERGKNLATAADFGQLQQQLSATTQMVETIKTEISQKDWINREWTNLRRIKLEELLENAGKCESTSTRHRNSCIDGKYFDEQDDPGDDFRTLWTLYFPELKEAGAYLDAYRHRRSENGILGMEMLEAGDDRALCDQVLKKFRLKSEESFPKFLQARRELESAARNLLIQIVGLNG
jgi:hypothetical protein